MSTITLVMYSSTSTQKVLVLEYEYKYTSTITPSLIHMCSFVYHVPTTYGRYVNVSLRDCLHPGFKTFRDY